MINSTKEKSAVKADGKSVKSFNIGRVVTIIVVAALLLFACGYYIYIISTRPDYKGERKEKFAFGKEVSVADGNDLTIHFLDVDQSESIFIEFPDGKNMLIDGGIPEESETVVSFLEDLNVKKIDLVLATHSDYDHVGGLVSVFEEFEVSYCFRPMVESEITDGLKRGFNPPSNDVSAWRCNTEIYNHFLKAVQAEKCGWSFFNKDSDFSQTFTFEGNEYNYSFDFYTPTADVADISYSKANAYSPICLLTYGDFSIMFTGDAESIAETEFLTEYKYVGYPDVDVLKVGHHGSSSSSSPEFIRAINPEYAVISCGKNNEYGHPTQKTLNALDGCWIYRTDLLGNIKLTVGVDGKPNFEPPITELL